MFLREKYRAEYRVSKGCIENDNINILGSRRPANVDYVFQEITTEANIECQRVALTTLASISTVEKACQRVVSLSPKAIYANAMF
jgi:hypothetical protein